MSKSPSVPTAQPEYVQQTPYYAQPANGQPQYGQGQPQYGQGQPQYGQPGYPTVQYVYAQQAPPQAGMNYAAPPQAVGPPTGHWRDGICDWGANIWPSCGCVCCFWGIGVAWLVAQISQKTGYINFYTVMRPFLIAYIIAWIVQLIFGVGLVYILPAFGIFIVGIMLRLHVTRTYRISENGDCGETMIGIFCWPCSVAQMARHVYGYTKVFDGDSDPEVHDHYSETTVPMMYTQNPGVVSSTGMAQPQGSMASNMHNNL